MWTLDPGAPPCWRPRQAAPGAVLAFTTRKGGVSAAPFDTLNVGRSTADDPEAVDANRRRVLQALGTDPDRLATAGQVHGARVERVTAPGLHRDCDGLVTAVPGIPLAVTAADCLPMLFVSERVVAAVHAGWRGLAAGIPAEAVKALVAEGASREAIRVHLGPSIRACCYAVGPEVAGRFPAEAVVRVNGGVHLDLVAAARAALRAAGVPSAGVDVVDACTACMPEWHYSHRRDRGRTGRQWGVVALGLVDVRGGREQCGGGV